MMAFEYAAQSKEVCALWLGKYVSMCVCNGASNYFNSLTASAAQVHWPHRLFAQRPKLMLFQTFFQNVQRILMAPNIICFKKSGFLISISGKYPLRVNESDI